MKPMPSPIQIEALRLSVIVLALLGSSGFAAPPAWLTRHYPEIKALVARMTLAEKEGQVTQTDWGALKDFDDIETSFSVQS